MFFKSLALLVLAAGSSGMAAAQLLYYQLEAPLVTGPASNAPQPKPLCGALVTLCTAGLNPGTPPCVTLTTDSMGRIPVSSGAIVISITVAGPTSSNIRVLRGYPTQAGVLYYPGTYVAAGQNLSHTLDVTAPVSQLAALYPSECNAFTKVTDARNALTSLTGIGTPGALDIDFLAVPTLFGNTAKYNPGAGAIPDAIEIGYVGNGAATAPGAFSYSLLAHEYAHRVIANAYNAASHGLADRIKEGLADFLASVVAGTHVIGEGVAAPGLPRDIDTNATSTSFSDPHTAGLVLAGALYHARAGFDSMGLASLFDSYIPGLVQAAPLNEDEFYCRLLTLDDNDGNLGNGTPHQSLISHAFESRHHIYRAAWCDVPQVMALSGGWGTMVLPVPALTAGFLPGTTNLVLSASTVPGRAAVLLVSPLPATSTQVGPGLWVAVDPANVLLGPAFQTGAGGSLSGTFALPAALSPFAVQLAVVESTAPFGVMTSNGLLIGS